MKSVKSTVRALAFAVSSVIAFCSWAQPGDPLCFTSEADGSTLSLSTAVTEPGHFECRLGDTGEWQSFSVGNTYTLDKGQKLYLRSSKDEYEDISGGSGEHSWFMMSEESRFAVSGDVTTLLRKGGSDYVHGYAFYQLFDSCPITSAPELPATTLGFASYCRMFIYCRHLTEPPELPAMVMQEECYESMFYCSGLTRAPALPAMTLAEACYMRMFEGCKFTEAPELPATELKGWCYQEMFRDCRNLVKAPVLPVQKLERSCYCAMFCECGSLKDAPELPSTELAQNCYGSMFESCTNLVLAPVLPAKTIVDACYDEMFRFCTALAEAPELPGTNVDVYCYAEMFRGCKSLKTAPKLPVTKLAESCYEGMFQECTQITTAPELPATELDKACYKWMFKDCTALEESPELSAVKLAEECYYYMFDGCSSLQKVTLKATTWLSGALTGWLEKTAAQGVVRCPASLALYEKSGSGLPDGWTREDYGASEDPGDDPGTQEDPLPPRPDPGKKGDPLRFTSMRKMTENDGYGFSMLQVTLATGVLPRPVFEVRSQQWVVDGWKLDENNVNQPIRHLEWGEWEPFDGSRGLMVQYGMSLEIRAATNGVQKISGVDGIPGSVYEMSTMIKGDGPMAVSGDVTTLLSRNGTDTVGDQGFAYLFSGFEYLETAPLLPATNLGVGCYAHMFRETAIVYPPELPATKIADMCYGQMFVDCKKLVEAPALPATVLADNCYWYMFAGCSALKKAPALPALTATVQCYDSMFSMCSSLKEAPALPATKLAVGCYQSMFNKCTSLKKTPELPAPVLEDGCYRQMFLGCSSLTEASLKATSCAKDETGWGVNYALDNWLSGVYPYGTVTCPKALSIELDSVNGVPAGWECVRIGGDPDPISPDPIKPDPIGPADIPVVSPEAVTGGAVVAKATILSGVQLDGNGAVAGAVELKLAKANAKTRLSKVTGSVTMLGGKKVTLKAESKNGYDFSAGPQTVVMSGKGVSMTVTLGTDAAGNVIFTGDSAGATVTSAALGGAMASPGGIAAYLDRSFRLGVEGEIFEYGNVSFLPDAEPVTVKDSKWVLGKAAAIKYAKLKGSKDKAKVLQGYDDPKKPNIPGLKLAYTAKKGTFKGSFCVYALQGAAGKEKLKKYTVNVEGVVVNGVGHGIATCKKPKVGPFKFEVK